MIKSWMFKPQESGLPLTGWTYRKSITLSRASGAVTNYQMKLLVGESSGATGEDVDCASHCLSSFNDIRFTTSDGTTLLDYWIESISGTTPNQLATIWIEFNSIGTGATTFYMYYGNSGAAAYSSGANTFIVFDDFERGNNGDEIGGDWVNPDSKEHAHISTTYAFGGTRSVKMITLDGTLASRALPVTVSAEVAIRFRAYKPDVSYANFIVGDGSTYLYIKWDNTDEKIYSYNGSSWVDSSVTVSHSAWHLFEINNLNWTADTFNLDVDGTTIITNGAQRPTPGFSNQLRIAEAYSSTGVYYDDVLVRNWRSTEPAWGAWGAEES